jgi:hypothetical protein
MLKFSLDELFLQLSKNVLLSIQSPAVLKDELLLLSCSPKNKISVKRYQHVQMRQGK